MEQLDKLLEHFKEIKNQAEYYASELSSKRAEIEGVLERTGEESYQNEFWKITQVPAKNQKKIKIKDFTNALDKANLDESQIQILKDAISKINYQEHIRITKKKR